MKEEITKKEIRIIEKTFQIVSELNWVADDWKEELEMILEKIKFLNIK